MKECIHSIHDADCPHCLRDLYDTARHRIAALEARCQEEHELAETQAASAEKGWNRVRELEAALKLGWKVVASDSYDGACDCVTCVPKREFLKTAEKLTAPETEGDADVHG